MIITTLAVAGAIAALAWLKHLGTDIVSGSDR